MAAAHNLCIISKVRKGAVSHMQHTSRREELKHRAALAVLVTTACVSLIIIIGAVVSTRDYLASRDIHEPATIPATGEERYFEDNTVDAEISVRISSKTSTMKHSPAGRSSSRSPGRRSGRKKTGQPRSTGPPVYERPLLCTLGAKAKTRAMFPRDSLCTYLVYTHLANDAAGFMRPRNSPTFELFQAVARASRHTEFGASLDYASLLKNRNRTYPKQVERLAKLQSANIMHYGVLNFVLPEELDNGVKASLNVLKVFKKYMKTRHRSSKKTHHVMLGMKFESVNQEDLSKQYVDKVDEVLQAFPITMLVLITHVTSFPDKTDQLTGGAPWRAPASANYLSVEYGCKILREASIPKTVTAMVSFTMAVSEFRVKEAWTPDLGTQVEAEQMKLVPFCKTQVPEYSMGFVKKAQGFQVAGNKAAHTVVVFDTEETLDRKVNYTLRVYDHLPSGIAAFNVEYDDYNKHCSNGFHQRLGAIKNWL